MLNLIAREVATDAKGFDCNAQVTADQARVFARTGFQFAVRYVGRESVRPQDITPRELVNLTAAGLQVMLVQHVEHDAPPWWVPTADKGARYGAFAVVQARALDYPQGATIWLDLEGVVPGTDPEVVIEYSNLWYDAVKAANYMPGIYTGFGSQLGPTALYKRLQFRRYWRALNLNDDEVVAVRGVCMRQHEAHAPGGIPYPIDTNTVMKDAFGCLPWAATLK